MNIKINEGSKIQTCLEDMCTLSENTFQPVFYPFYYLSKKNIITGRIP